MFIKNLLKDPNDTNFVDLLKISSGIKFINLDKDPDDTIYTNEFLICEYSIQKNVLLGRGGSAKVFKAINIDTYEDYVIYVIFFYNIYVGRKNNK